MLLIGKNILSLNGATVCGIVSRHLNDSMGYTYSTDFEIKVENVSHKEGVYSFEVTLAQKDKK